jgi:hypothetical protein
MSAGQSSLKEMPMASSKPSLLHRQVTRVHRRLLWQSLLNTLVWCWAAALLLAAAWFVAQPQVLDQPPAWLRWTVAGGLVGLATLVGVLLGALRSPSRLAAALSLDAEFGLKERVTTSLMLAPEQKALPAAQALLEDVNQRITKLDIGSRFPLRMSWTAALVPLSVAILALVALFYEPSRSHAKAHSVASSLEQPPNAAEIEQKLTQLSKKPVHEKASSEKPRSEEIERLEAELEKIASRPHKTKEDIRERVKEMTALEDMMKARANELGEKSRGLQKQLQQLGRLSQNETSEGPAKDLEKALSQGKMDKAREELERLNKRLRNNQLTEKEKELLSKQLEKIKNKLDRVAKQKDKEDKLKKANLDAETLKREMNQLKKENDKLKDLQDLAKQLGQCQKSLKEGDTQAAADKLSAAGEKLKNMEATSQDLDDLREELQRLQDAKDSCCKGMGDNLGEPIEQEMTEDTDSGGPGSGRRPLGKEKPWRSFEARTKAEFDPKGKKIFDGYAPGQNFRKKSTPEIFGEIKQASQEAPEAIEQQRVPKAAKEMMKGYFEKMSEQFEDNQKAAPKK